MIRLLTIFSGAVLWGLAASFEVVVAIGKYGLLGFLAGVLLALGLLIYKAFWDKKGTAQLWIFIFRGLGVGALLFPVSNLIMVYMISSGFPYDETRAVLIESGLIGLLLALVFFFNAHLIKKSLRRRLAGFAAGEKRFRLKRRSRKE